MSGEETVGLVLDRIPPEAAKDWRLKMESLGWRVELLAAADLPDFDGRVTFVRSPLGGYWRRRTRTSGGLEQRVIGLLVEPRRWGSGWGGLEDQCVGMDDIEGCDKLARQSDSEFFGPSAPGLGYACVGAGVVGFIVTRQFGQGFPVSMGPWLLLCGAVWLSRLSKRNKKRLIGGMVLFGLFWTLL